MNIPDIPNGDWNVLHTWLKISDVTYIYLFAPVAYDSQSTDHISVFQSYIDEKWIVTRYQETDPDRLEPITTRFGSLEDAINAAMGLLL